MKLGLRFNNCGRHIDEGVVFVTIILYSLIRGYMNTFEKLRKNGIIITQEDIKAIAEKYKIKKLSVFGSRRAVDIVEPAGIQNPYRRNAILSSVERLIEII